MKLRECDRGRPIQILLVEDNPSDAELTVESLRFGRLDNRLCVVEDGEEAMSFLRRRNGFAQAPRPDLILLDLNLPRKNGREVLTEIKADASLKDIPVVILTSSEYDRDVVGAFGLNAGCYLTKGRR